MKRTIIIEGPDNTGKSHLATYLKNQLASYHPTIRHFGSPVTKGSKVLQEQLHVLHMEMRGIDDGSGLEIWDRSVIGECVYGPTYRAGQYNHAEYGVEMAYATKQRERQIFCIVIYTDGELFKRLNITSKKDETEKYQLQTEAANVGRLFVNVATNLRLKNTLFVNCANYATLDERNNYIARRVSAWLKFKRFNYDMADDYTQTFFNAKNMLWSPIRGFVKRSYQCKEFINERCRLGRDHREHCAYGKAHDQPTAACGALRKIEYVFVGEAPGHKGCGKLGIPFFGDWSGNLLQEAFDSCGILPTRYYMTNVVKCCPKDNDLGSYNREKLLCVQQLRDELEDILHYNPDATMIALGKVAAHELATMKLTARMMYHPAYYLRTGRNDDFMADFRKVVCA